MQPSALDGCDPDLDHALTSLVPKNGLCLVAAIALASGAFGCPPEEARAPVPKPSAPPPAAPAPEPIATASPQKGEMRIYFRDDWFGGVTLLGVDPNGPRAILRLESEAPPRLAIDSIDLERGQRVERWDVESNDTRRALQGRGFALTSAFETDLVRFAKIIGTLGPWHMRPSLPAPTFAVNGDVSTILFGAPPADGRDGDWLIGVGKDGKNPQRVDDGLRASYSPVFSPDGFHVAFRGCTLSPCDYGLFLTQLGGKPRRVSGLAGSTPPVFSKTGEVVYAVGNGPRAGTRCLYKASVTGSSTPSSVACVQGLTDVSFVEDPDGRTGVLSGVRGIPGQQSVDFNWVLLEDGTVLQTHMIDRAIGSGVINGSGLLALPMQKGALAIVDLINQKRVIVPDSDGWFFGFDTTRWLGDWLVLLRKPEGLKGYQLVGLDARALLDEK